MTAEGATPFTRCRSPSPSSSPTAPGAHRARRGRRRRAWGRGRARRSRRWRRGGAGSPCATRGRYPAAARGAGSAGRDRRGPPLRPACRAANSACMRTIMSGKAKPVMRAVGAAAIFLRQVDAAVAAQDRHVAARLAVTGAADGGQLAQAGRLLVLEHGDLRKLVDHLQEAAGREEHARQLRVVLHADGNGRSRAPSARRACSRARPRRFAGPGSA